MEFFSTYEILYDGFNHTKIVVFLNVPNYYDISKFLLPVTKFFLDNIVIMRMITTFSLFLLLFVILLENHKKRMASINDKNEANDADNNEDNNEEKKENVNDDTNHYAEYLDNDSNNNSDSSDENEEFVIIGITGRKRSGKDTVGNYLVEHYGFVKVSFADTLKEACKIIFGFSDEQVYGDELKD